MGDDPIRQRPDDSRRFLIFQLLWIIASVVLMFSTWRLWVGTDLFPQIPLLSVFVGTSIWIDHVALVICGGASILIVAALISESPSSPRSLIPFKLRIGCLVWAAALLLLFCTNQHRLQPWAWQFFLFALLPVLSSTKHAAIVASRVIVISIYLWSAIGKFDFQFLNGLGQQFTSAIIELIGFPVAAETISPWFVALLPLGELIVGILLTFSTTRKFGVIAAIGLHLGLVGILGPWGMAHHWGVVIWNFFFALITTVLFWPPKKQTGTANERPVPALPLSNHFAATVFTIIVVALPLYPNWDHWLAWGLYSPNNRRSTLQVVPTSQQEFDPSIQPFLVPADTEFVGGVEVLKVDLGRMSLELLDAPIYPEARMQLGVIHWLQQRYLPGPAIITIQSKSDRFTGMREEKTIQRIEPDGKETPFFFNHLPR